MADEHQNVLARFLKDTATHEMVVHQDYGVYRDLAFKKPGDSAYRFNLVTWPGYLCISGDMGTYVFSRLTDMFTFFRSEKPELTINPSYWSEKCQAADRNGKVKEFSPDLFKAAIAERLETYLEGFHDPLDEMKEKELREAVDDWVLTQIYDGPQVAFMAARDFDFDNDAVFDDFGENPCETYTFHFLWICYAIQWGIRQYDAARKGEEK